MSPAARRSRAMRWAIGVGAALVTAIGLVLMFLLAQATNNRAFYEQNYARLFGINVVVAALLMLIIGWVAFRLLRRLRQGKFGSRLLIKLAAIFALVVLQERGQLLAQQPAQLLLAHDFVAFGRMFLDFIELILGQATRFF